MPEETNRPPGILEEMTVDDIRAFRPEVVVLPLGSTEPHGPHLPYGTDSFQVTSICRPAVEKANALGGRVLLYPTLPITNNANVRKFPFACRIGVRTLMTVILDIVAQCKEDGVMKVVIVNGHGGNPAAIAAAQREISAWDNPPFVCTCWGWEFWPADFKDPIEHESEHGGESETSRMMWIRPDLVRADKLADNPMAKLRLPSLSRTQFVRPWHLYVPVSAGGDTRKSSPEKGRAITEASADGLARFLADLSAAPFDERFPYV